MNLDGIKWEAGTWRAIIMTSQHWYPIAGMKMLNKAKVQGMSVTNFHLDTPDAMRLYRTKYIPSVSNKEQLVSKIVRFQHTPAMMVIGPN